jgi:glycosyltransferase involved in cell wall biosynthesis
MTTLRILHVISGIDRADGGPTTALLQLTRALRRLQADVTVVATPRSSAESCIAEELRNSGIRIRVDEYRRQTFGRDSMLNAMLIEEITRADVVHIHALWEQVQYQAASISRALKTPFIVRPCGLLDPWSMAQHRLKKRLYLDLRLRRHLNAAAAMHYSTRLEAERAQSLRIQSPSIVEPNGIDLDEFRDLPPSGTFRRRLNISERAPIVLFLGRIHPKKGIELLIRAFSDGAPHDAILVIVGAGEREYESSLHKMATSHGLENRVKFVGFLNGRKRIAAFADANVFVLPSHAENFANTVMESLAAGTPVIVSDRIGVHPEVASWRVGSVVPRERQALSDAIHDWLADGSLRETARVNAPSFLAAYDVRDVATRWLRRYRKFSQPDGCTMTDPRAQRSHSEPGTDSFSRPST